MPLTQNPSPKAGRRILQEDRLPFSQRWEKGALQSTVPAIKIAKAYCSAIQL
jgi:hypothetical protein